MKTLKKFFGLFVMAAFVLVSCGKENEPTPDPAPTPDDEEEVVVFPDIMPAVDAPGAGNITIAIYVPENTCNGVILTGSFDGYNPGAKEYPFTKLEGEDRWYTITVPYASDFAAKAIALTAEGKADWGTQWGMNIPADEIENVVILSGEAVLTEENGGEQKLTAVPDGTVVFVGIKEWKSAPCVERNKAGEATFTLTAVAPLPEGALVGIVGNLSEELNWNITAPVVMTQNGNTYTATVSVGESCEYKYFVSLDGTTWDWNIGEDGGNRQMPLDLKPVDTVEAWKGLPAEEEAQ